MVWACNSARVENAGLEPDSFFERGGYALTVLVVGIGGGGVGGGQGSRDWSGW